MRSIKRWSIGVLIAGYLWASSIQTQAPITDGIQVSPPSTCQMVAATTAFTAGPTITRAAANNLVLSATTNTTAGTITLDCDFELQSRSTVGTGATITGFELYYGVQTTALSSIAALIPATVTYPATGGAAQGTVATIGGSLTVTPVSLQLTTTTSGQCFHEHVAFGTPFAVNSAVQKISLEQVFTTAGTSATTLQVCAFGVALNYSY